MRTVDLLSTPNNPKPQGAIVEMVTTRDGVHLRTARFLPTDNFLPGGKPVGTVCLFQGRAECIEKYYEVIEALRRRGFVVATMDWRGQGLSDRALKKPMRGHVRHFTHYQRDLEGFLTEIVSPHCPAPYFALAHSMGGHILYAASAHGPGRFFDRMVLTAPMLHLAPRMLVGFHWIRPGRLAMSNKIVSQRLTRWGAGLMRMIGLGRLCAFGGKEAVVFNFEDNLLTSDRVRYERFNELLAAHPSLGVAAPTYGWLYAACLSMRRSVRPHFIRQLSVPTLIIASGADQIVSTPAIEKIVPLARMMRHIVIRQARHEIMFENDDLRQQFWAAFDVFIPGSTAFETGKARAGKP